jgi:hypothetical protein
MSQKIIYKAVFAAICCSAAMESKALPTGTPAMICNSCANPTILQRLREERPTFNTSYVIDFDRRQLRRYQRQKNGSFKEIIVDEPERHYFALLMEFRDRNGGSLLYIDRTGINRSVSHPVEDFSVSIDGVTAWQVVDSGQEQNRVANYLNSSFAVGPMWAKMAGNLHMALGNVRILFGVDDPGQIRVGVLQFQAQLSVDFTDGSVAKFTWNPYSKSFEYLPNSARDSNDNTIPDTESDVTGGPGRSRRYTFPGTAPGSFNAIDFNRRIVRWNVVSPPPSAPSVLACAQAQGGPKVCTLER